VGCEIAEMLADIIPDESADTKKHFEHVVATYGVRVFTETLIKQITKATLIIETKGERRKGP
jgi:hypothetical protein